MSIFRHNKKNIIIFIVFFLSCLIVSCVLYNIYQHEKKQNLAINNLIEKVSILEAKEQKRKSSKVKWLDNSYSWLAIGNSITFHKKSLSWRNNAGVAASDTEHDYFHLVKEYIQSKHKLVDAKIFTFSVWEVQSHDRDETLDFLTPYLDETLDLITIQLAENARDISTYEADFVSLIEFIKDKCPKAEIIVIGDFWEYMNRDKLKENACMKTGVIYVSLDEVKNNKAYYCGMGTVVLDDNNHEYIVEHSGIADHPGNNGMQAIADRVIKHLSF